MTHYHHIPFLGNCRLHFEKNWINTGLRIEERVCSLECLLCLVNCYLAIYTNKSYPDEKRSQNVNLFMAASSHKRMRYVFLLFSEKFVLRNLP